MYRLHKRTYKAARILSVCVAVLLFSPVLNAQNNSTESPYTRFGIGELSQSTSNVSRGLGNTGIALHSKGHINPKNPASYVAVDSQTFILDFSTSLGWAWYAENGRRDNRILGNFEYLSMLFPVSKWMAISAGIMPYSSVGYRLGSTQGITGSTQKEYSINYQGSGNINEIYLGTAFSPYKGLSLGINGSFLLGELEHTQLLSYSDANSFNTLFYDALRLNGFKASFGVQYGFAIGKKDKLTVGLTYTPSLALKSILLHEESIVQSGVTQSLNKSDSIASNSAYRVPEQFGLGAAYEISDKLLLTGDVQYNIWKNALPETATYKVQNQWQTGLGIAYTPAASDRSFWKRVEYRGGLSLENSYLRLPVENALSGYYKGGVSIGLSIPMIDRRSFLDLTLDYGHLTPQASGLVHENSLRLTIGLRFNEGWFRKIKLD